MFTIRPVVEDDEDFIYSTFLKSYKTDSIEGRRTYGHIFFPAQHDIVENMLQRGTTLIACWDKDPQVIAGYLTFEKDPQGDLVLHYAFTKTKFRRQGVLRTLLEKAGFKKEDRPRFTHWTNAMDELIRHYPGWRYDPYLRT